MNYTIIKTKKQYKEYSHRLWALVNKKQTVKIEDEVDLLDIIIQDYEGKHFKYEKLDPIPLLKYLMQNQKLKADDMAVILGITKKSVDQILSCRIGLSKDVIKKLCNRFKMHPEAFNRTYPLVSKWNRGRKNEQIMNTIKKL